jgi:hypothetical protein
MVWIRIIFVAFIVLYIVYYVLLLGHLLGAWKMTNAKIEMGKFIIPFYYFTKL